MPLLERMGCMEKTTYAFMSRASLEVGFYMIREDHVFVTIMVVIDAIQKTMALSVISVINVVAKLSAIVKIHKYERSHEEHHFILMAMEVHGKLGVIWIVSSGSVFAFSTIKNQEIIYLCLFAFNFLGNMLVLLFSMLYFLL
jgi:hypothetical protein